MVVGEFGGVYLSWRRWFIHMHTYIQLGTFSNPTTRTVIFEIASVGQKYLKTNRRSQVCGIFYEWGRDYPPRIFR